MHTKLCILSIKGIPFTKDTLLVPKCPLNRGSPIHLIKCMCSGECYSCLLKQ